MIHDTEKVLREAARILDEDKRWVQNDIACAKDGKATGACDDDAVGLCMAGAIYRASGRDGEEFAEKVFELVADDLNNEEATRLAYDGELDPLWAIGEWNDRMGRTKLQVMERLKRIADKIGRRKK